MRRLEVSSEAELEVFAAALRYERERPGLGFRFEANVHGLFARLIENPFQFLEIEEGARRARRDQVKQGLADRVECRQSRLALRPRQILEGP
jgi:hypothetical protein